MNKIYTKSGYVLIDGNTFKGTGKIEDIPFKYSKVENWTEKVMDMDGKELNFWFCFKGEIDKSKKVK